MEAACPQSLTRKADGQTSHEVRALAIAAPGNQATRIGAMRPMTSNTVTTLERKMPLKSRPISHQILWLTLALAGLAATLTALAHWRL